MNVEKTRPVIVPNSTSSYDANRLYGESYGVDWVYKQKAPSALPEPIAWISRIKCVGPDFGKEIYGKLPVQSLQAGYYEHIPLYGDAKVSG